MTNLPFNTTARDLNDIIRATKAKSCYIPRSNQYKPKPFAILFFDNATNLNDAVKQNFAYGGNNLEWVSADTKLCHKCGSPNHIALKCPKLFKPIVTNSNNTPTESSTKLTINQKERLQKLYNKYRPAGIRIKPKFPTDKNALSYAETAKANKGKNKESTTSPQTETVKDSTHNPEKNKTSKAAEPTNLEKKLDLIINKLDSMQNSINKLNDRINKLEEWKDAFNKQNVTPPPPVNDNKAKKIIDITPNKNASSSTNTFSLKRIRVTNSSSESDTPNTPVPVTTSNPDPKQIINEQSNLIKEQQQQLHQCMEEIRRLSNRLI